MKKTCAAIFVLLLTIAPAQAAAKKAPAKSASSAAEAPAASEPEADTKTNVSKSSKSGKAGAFGLGADLNASLVGRYWMSNKVAFDAAVGLGDMNFTSRFFWIPEVRAGLAFTVATIPTGVGTLPFYLGAGAAFRPYISSAFKWGVGIYGAAGFNFIPAKAPIDVFAEIRPTLGITDGIWFGGLPLGFGSTAVGVSFVPTAGLRYYF